MAKIHLHIGDDLIEKFQRVAGLSPVEATKDALTIFNWVVDETARSRFILSSDDTGTDMKRLEIPALQEVSRRRQEWLQK